MTESCVAIVDLKNFEFLLKGLGLSVMSISRRIITQGEMFDYFFV